MSRITGNGGFLLIVVFMRRHVYRQCHRQAQWVLDSQDGTVAVNHQLYVIYVLGEAKLQRRQRELKC